MTVASAYTITDLGVLPGSTSSEARAITARGQIVGSCSASGPSNAGRAALWNGITITDLGALLGAKQSGAEAVNDRGQVVGWSAYDVAPFSRATLWSLADGSVVDLSLSATSDDLSGSGAYSLNRHGRIAGYVDTPTPFNASQAAVWEDGLLSLLRPAPGDATSAAYAINDQGIVVGSSGNVTDARVLQQACRWLPSEERTTSSSPYQDLEGISLGTLPGGGQSVARGINELGQVVGSAMTDEGVEHAVLWQDERIIDLGVYPGAASSTAHAINAVGQIVGSSSVGSGPSRWEHAILWENGSIIDLGTFPGGGSSMATAINDAGQIVGAAWTVAGERHAALWTPTA